MYLKWLIAASLGSSETLHLMSVSANKRNNSDVEFGTCTIDSRREKGLATQRTYIPR